MYWSQAVVQTLGISQKEKGHGSKDFMVKQEILYWKNNGTFGLIIALRQKRARGRTETILLLNVEMYIFDIRKVYTILVAINERNSET